MDEVEDAVPAGIHAGGYARPRYRTLRRNGGSQGLEIAVAAQLVQIREGTPVGRKELRIHTVDPEDDHALAGCLCRRMRASASENREDGNPGLHAAASRSAAGAPFWKSDFPSM